MANTLLTPSVIAKRALATLYNTTVLAGLVWRDYDPEFNGKVGDTVTIRKPAVFEGKTFVRDTGIEPQTITETSDTVKLDDVIDVSVEVTAEELTLEIDEFDTRILQPMMEAINQRIDGDLATELATAAGDIATIPENGQPHNVFTGDEGAVASLGRAKAPKTDRFAVFSPEGEGVMLGDELFLTANKSGSTDGLRNASIGRALGFETYGTETLGGDLPDGIAFHRHAVAFVNRTLALPLGADGSRAAVANYKGFGLRVVKDYSITKKQDVISVDTLVGYKSLRANFAIELGLGVTGS